MLHLIDNFIDDKDSLLIEELLLSNKFTWFYIGKTVDTLDNIIDDELFVTTPFFRHVFVSDWEMNSNYAGYVKPLAKKVESLFDREFKWFNMSANLVIPNSDGIGKLCFPHIDVNYDSDIRSKYDTYTGLYYVNDVDGDTVMFNEEHDGREEIKSFDKFTIKESVSPKRNRLIYWNTDQFHSAPASGTKTRSVINLNFLVKK